MGMEGASETGGRVEEARLMVRMREVSEKTAQRMVPSTEY